tara:strand:- start:123 stop:401 length:279 start_codon:yes stop_codon:yes gene_type:complete
MQSLINVDERLDKDGNDWQNEKMALNRNVFNNQRRNVRQNASKPRTLSSQLNGIQEEEKENLDDEGQDHPSQGSFENNSSLSQITEQPSRLS